MRQVRVVPLGTIEDVRASSSRAGPFTVDDAIELVGCEVKRERERKREFLFLYFILFFRVPKQMPMILLCVISFRTNFEHVANVNVATTVSRFFFCVVMMRVLAPAASFCGGREHTLVCWKCTEWQLLLMFFVRRWCVGGGRRKHGVCPWRMPAPFFFFFCP